MNKYTDLALEAHGLAVDRTGGEINGVNLKEAQSENARITRIEIMNEQGAQAMGKPVGEYVTIESPGLKGQKSSGS